MTIWHTRNEKKILKRFHAKPHHPGYDGVLPNGKPVEIRETRRDDRYRIQKNVHNQMVRKDGVYIFKNGNRIKQVPAKTVSKLIRDGKWFKDRSYPHKFVKKKQVF